MALLPTTNAGPLGAPVAATGGAEPAAVTDDGAPEGYRICIDVAVDGSLSVGMTSTSGEGPTLAPEAMAVADDADGTEMAAMNPATDIKDALTQALAIYKAQGADAAGQADFERGFRGR